MSLSLQRWQFSAFIFIALWGVLLHFAYDWSGQSPLVAPFSGVNESTWEHMKLFFFSSFPFALAEGHFIGGKISDFWTVKLYGIILGLLLIPAIFYTFNGSFGPSPDWYNITIFFQATFFSLLLERHLFRHPPLSFSAPAISQGILWAVAAAFILFTRFPPKIPLFQDPLTMGYGI